MAREHIQQAIAVRAGDGTDARRNAAAVVSAFTCLEREIGMVVGAQASAALCAHAFHRTRATLSWSIPPFAMVSDKLMVALGDDLQMRPAANVLKAGEQLLLALVDHLASLIGLPLTNRLLHAAWGARGSVPDSQELS